MSNSKLFNVAIVGITGAVGQQMIRLLEERNFPIAQLKLLASSRSAGKKVSFKGRDITVEEALPTSFKGIDIAFFSAGTGISLELVPYAVASGAICIDNTNAFRMDPETPLVVPEVNIEKINEHKGIIANPNCSTIQMVAALKPLYNRYGISRIIVSTYQAVSGAGSRAIEELAQQSKDAQAGKPILSEILPVGSLPVKHQIAFNVIPQIDKFLDNGFTNEEMKMILETKKIMGDDTIQVTATCVRVPVVFGHSESVYVELDQAFEMDEVRQILSDAPGIVLKDDPLKQLYPLAIDAAGKLDTYVGRVRRDLENSQALNMWIVSDNLLKGAAWNAVQIAEYIALEK